MDPVIRLLLAGIDRNKNPGNKFYGMPKDVLKIIWRMVVQHYQRHIEYGKIFLTPIRELPRPKIQKYETIDVNMLPFSLSNPENTLPDNLREWIPIIKLCKERCWYPCDIAYLTVHRSFVKRGETQRRPGIHIDAPVIEEIVPGKEDMKRDTSRPAHYVNISWGSGAHLGMVTGGIFILTDTPNSCAAWNLGIKDLASLIQPTFDEYVRSTTNDNRMKRERPFSLPGSEGGGVNLDFLRSHLDRVTKIEAPKLIKQIEDDSQRKRMIDERWIIDKQAEASIPEYKVLDAKTLYYMTDRTPHCALPVKEDCVRTFFRLVIGKVGVRWVDDCTPNDLVQIPEDVIIKKTKFV